VVATGPNYHEKEMTIGRGVVKAALKNALERELRAFVGVVHRSCGENSRLNPSAGRRLDVLRLWLQRAHAARRLSGSNGSPPCASGIT
jgi:hypothetical protein